jgi:hypothetical protein
VTLADLIRKRDTAKSANANSAKAANDGQVQKAPLARLATLALANPTSPKVAPRQDDAEELRHLVREAGEYYAFTDAEHVLALEIALSDPVAALICFRSINERLRGGS